MRRMQPGDDPRWTATVRAHHHKTIGFLFARSPPCLDIRQQEIREIQRQLRPLDPEDLPRFRPPPSWVLGALLCAGDDTQLLAPWARSLPAPDLERIHFYHHPRLDPVAAYKPWIDEGLPEPRYAIVDGFRTFHPLFGYFHANRVYLDFH